MAALAVLSSTHALAQKKYDNGATDSEIRIGNTMPYSGPAAAYGVMGKVEAAYFRMINDQGGINGRRINFISYDDAYNPAQTIAQARKLVETDQVLFLFGTLGTASNTGLQPYLNSKKIPQLFVASGATKWGDPRQFPWTMGWQQPYQSEGRTYAKYVLAEKPNGKIEILYQNDDYGRDFLRGIKDGLGGKAASMVKQEESYEVSEPTIDSHIARLQAAGVDVLISIATPKFAIQAIQKVANLKWQPLHIVNNVGSSVPRVLQIAGFDKAQGLLSASYAKDTSDPRWDKDEGMMKYQAFLAKYAPDVKSDSFAAYGYGEAQTLVQVLRQAGDVLTRDNIMKQAASLKNFKVDTLLPGISVDTSATNFFPIEQFQMMRFKGERLELFGPVINGDIGRNYGGSNAADVRR